MDSSLIRARPRRGLSKPLLLKDHLLDDMSSCSSNGFKSFPRRSRCCTAVRFVHDFERRNKQHLKDPDGKPFSAIRRIIAAVKLLPFAAAKSPEKKKLIKGGSSFGRSFSRKILEKSGFWKRKHEAKENRRLESFDRVTEDDSEPSAGSDSSRDSNKSSTSWSASDFTVCSSGNSSSEVNLNSTDDGDVDHVVEDGVLVGKSGGDSTDSTSSRGGCSADTNSSTNTTKQKQWSSDQEKERSSPVSVLDCPFDDEEDDEVSSLFQHRLAHMEGTKMKLMKKIQRFECLAKLEPVNLATKFTSQPDSDNESSGSPLPHSSSSIDDKSISDIITEEDEENETEHKALELLHRMKAGSCSSSYHGLKLKEDKLLLDFFREKIANKHANSETQWDVASLDKGILEEAENWVNGQKAREVFVAREERENREAYVEDMEKRGEWRTLDREREEVGLELENVVFVQLMDELLLEISN